MKEYRKYYVSDNVSYDYEENLSGWNVIYYMADYLETIWKSIDRLNKKQFLEIVIEHRKGIRK